jgi:hypothetical protein
MQSETIPAPRCSNAQIGSFNHECGRPASFQGTHASGHKQWFCGECRTYGHEARGVKSWLPIEKALAQRIVCAEDLTPEGIQYVLPGAERIQPASVKQGSLF